MYLDFSGGNLTSDELFDSPTDAPLTRPGNYYPYANKSLFLLGDGMVASTSPS
jgi:hypothetical protein